MSSIIGYAISGLVMSICIYVDNKRFTKQVSSGDIEQVFKMQEIKTWLILIFLIGIVALPAYAVKTRGNSTKGFLFATMLFCIYVGIFVASSFVLSMVFERNPRQMLF